jgi:hypothetical protein
VKNGIKVKDVDGVEVEGNHIHARNKNAGDGIDLSHDTGTINVGSNIIKDFAIGINVNHTDNVQFASNQVTGTGTYGVSVDSHTGIITYNGSIGVKLTNSDNATFNGDSFVSNAVGIELNGSKNTTISGVNSSNNGVALYAHNHKNRGSSGTVVENGSTFNNDYIGVALNGNGTTFSFGGTSSFFTGESYYFALANGVMNGLIIDASNQSFDGTLGVNFNQSQYDAAEGITVDSHTPVAGVGTVCYLGATCPSFGTGPTPAHSGNGLFSLFLLQNEEALDEPVFSYAGQTILDAAPNLTPGTVNLSLLSPASGSDSDETNYEIVEKNSGTFYRQHHNAQVAGNTGNTGTPSLQTLSPSAGGNVQRLQTLSPSAGGNGFTDFGNNFLGAGFEPSFNQGVGSSGQVAFNQ